MQDKRSEIPEDMLCPITLQIMVEPVMLIESGHTYEREALLEHLQVKQTDPSTNNEISNAATAPNHLAKRLILAFLEKERLLNPDIVNDIYLPNALVQTLISALEKNNVTLFKETLKKDSRLLHKVLKDGKTIFRLTCESGSLESLEIVVSALGDRVKQGKGIEIDQELSTFFMVSRRLGLKGASCIAKAMDWKSPHFQEALTFSVQQTDIEMVNIVLSLGAVATPEILDKASNKKNISILKCLILSDIKPSQLQLEEQLLTIQAQKIEIESLKAQLGLLTQGEKTLNTSGNTSSFFKSNNFPKNTTYYPTSTTTTSSTIVTATTSTIFGYVEQVAAMSRSAHNKINPDELKALLKWVTEGHLVEVGKLLKKNPILALGTGTVTDLSNRTFQTITALQYAAWALDTEMCELIRHYAGEHNSVLQMKALAESPQNYSAYGASYDAMPLVTNYQTYLDNYGSWNELKLDRYWQKNIGGEQRKCPAWLIYAWSEEGSDVAWMKQDETQKVNREYDKNRLVWWFGENCNDWRLGVSWAAIRKKEASQSLGDSQIYIIGSSALMCRSLDLI